MSKWEIFVSLDKQFYVQVRIRKIACKYVQGKLFVSMGKQNYVQVWKYEQGKLLVSMSKDN